MSPSILKGFRAPTRALSNIQDGFDRTGLVGGQDKRKPAFELRQSFYDDPGW
jgi:hypothetical protein